MTVQRDPRHDVPLLTLLSGLVLVRTRSGHLALYEGFDPRPLWLATASQAADVCRAFNMTRRPGLERASAVRAGLLEAWRDAHDDVHVRFDTGRRATLQEREYHLLWTALAVAAGGTR